MSFKLKPLKEAVREEVIQVSHVPGCAWSSSSLASCNYCVERARPPSVSTVLMDDRGSRAGKTCSGCCDEKLSHKELLISTVTPQCLMLTCTLHIFMLYESCPHCPASFTAHLIISCNLHLHVAIPFKTNIWKTVCRGSINLLLKKKYQNYIVKILCCK